MDINNLNNGLDNNYITISVEEIKCINENEKCIGIFICIFLMIFVICRFIYENIERMIEEKGFLNGPKYFIPYIGNLYSMIFCPEEFYEKQLKYGKISWNCIMGKSYIFLSEPKLIKYVFSNPEGKMNLWLHYNAERILGKKYNIAFMNGSKHEELRSELMFLFNSKSLKDYAKIQKKVIINHLNNWSTKHPIEIRLLARDLNLDTSIAVFIGEKWLNKDEINLLKKDFYKMNDGLLAIPFEFYGTSLYFAVKSRKRIINLISEKVIPNIISNILNNNLNESNSNSLLEKWLLKVKKANLKQKQNKEYAFHILDFIFANQDATTSGIAWVLEYLSLNQNWQEKILKDYNSSIEIGEKSINDEKMLFGNILNEYNITSNDLFVKEVLRIRPPAIYVPHIVLEDFKLDDKYEMKKGMIIFPGIWWAQNFDPSNTKQLNTFDPERYTKDNDIQEEKVNFVFGHGSHTCLGRIYAPNQLKIFTIEFLKKFKFHRIRTATSDKIRFIPTIIPKDGCLVQLYPK
jgi:cytochrome P450 family 710 subfamily A protein